MKHPRITGIIFLALLNFTVARTLSAQWSKVGSNFFIPSGYKPWGMMAFKNGTLCAGLGSVVISLDTGKTWTQAITFASTEVVASIDFFDSANFLVQTSRTLYITADRGYTWINYPFSERDTSFYGTAACFAGSVSNIVVASQDTMFTSNDGGFNWVKTRNFGRGLAVSFLTYHNGQVFGDEFSHLIISNDNGMTWSQSNNDGGGNYAWTLAFSPCASSTEIFVADQDAEGGGGPAHIFTTYDFGATWQTSIQRPVRSITGDIVTAGNSIFFETSVDSNHNAQGVFRSTNEGITWDNIGGPSALFFDTRMLTPINDNIIVALDTNLTLWRTDNAGGFPVYSKPPVFSKPSPINISECQNGTSQMSITGLSCHRIHILSANLTGVDASSLSLTGSIPPYTLSDAETVSIGILFYSLQLNGVLQDSIIISWYDEGDGIVRDSIIAIPLTVRAVGPNLLAVDSVMQLKPIVTCRQLDTVILLHNIGCDTLRIISGPGPLSNEFSADFLSVPIYLPADSTIAVHIHFNTFTEGSFSAIAQFQAEHRGLMQQISVSLHATSTGPSIGMVFQDSSVAFPPITICAPKHDTVIYLKNTSCVALQIISGPDGLANGFSADAISLPYFLSPGDSIPITIHFSRNTLGSANSSVSFTGKLKEISQTKTILLSGKDIGANPGLRFDSSVNFHTVSLCSPDRDTLMNIFNQGCDSLTIISGPGNLGNGFTADPISLPVIIPPGSFITIHYHFHLAVVSPYQTTASFSWTSDGINRAITQVLSAVGIGGNSSPITLETTFIFDTLSSCGAIKDSAILFTNRGCDTLTVLNGPGTLGPGFTADALTFPILLAPNQSISVIFHFSPPGIGNFSATPLFTLERQGIQSTYSLTLEGSGKFISGTLFYDPKQIQFQNLTICGHDSATLMIRNGGCSPLTIDPVAIIGDPDFTLATNNLQPVILSAQDTVNYTIYFNPALKGLRQGYIVFGSNAFHDTVQIRGIVIDSSRTISESLQSIDFGIRRVCDNAADTSVTLKNTSCDTLIVSGFGISGNGFAISGNFPDTLSPGVSMEITITTLFDTSGGKLSSFDTLTLTSNADPITPIYLTESYNLAHKREVALFLDGVPKSGSDFTTVTYTIKETPGKTFAGAGIKQITFDLNYNTDLLSFDQTQSGNIITSDGKTFTLTGLPEIRADAQGILLSVGFKVYLTTDSTTTIDMPSRTDTTRRLPCEILTTSFGGSARFDYKFLCGDHTLQNYMNGILPMKIISFRPNPAQEEIMVEVQSPIKQDATLEIYDALGVKVSSVKSLMTDGTTTTHLDTRNLSAGMYVVRVTSASGSASQSFVKVH